MTILIHHIMTFNYITCTHERRYLGTTLTLCLSYCLQSLDSKCLIYNNEAYNGEVFLKNDDNDLLGSSGILELRYKKKWYPVCVSGSLTQIAANTACRQLGYTGSVDTNQIPSKYMSN